MKRYSVLVSVVTLFLLVLPACAGQAGIPPASEVPVITQPPAAEAPVTGVPVAEIATPMLVPVDLAGPPMEVGSTFLYIDGSKLVAVPAGPFIMGHGGFDNPEHEVTLSDFWIYQAEVTNQMYGYCVAVGECTSPDSKDNPDFGDSRFANYPVVGVTHDQAAAYCEFVHGRLPTEAEWEKTARGPEGNLYPWGDETPTCDYLNAADCVGKTTDITTYPQGKSYYEAVDMSGNVFEWVADWYSPTYYGESPAEDPLGPEFGKRRSVRSSGFPSEFYFAEAARRSSLQPNEQHNDLGFRCVVEDPTYFAPFCSMIALYGSGPGGGLQGNAIDPECPAVSVTAHQFACNGQQGGQTQTRVIFESSDPGAVINPSGMPGCSSESSGPTEFARYLCDPQSSFTASIQASCSYPDPGPAECASERFTFDPATGMCNWDGTGSIGDQCPRGYNYDPVNNCCTVQPGSGVNYPLCPGGASPVQDPPGVYKCLYGAQPPKTDNVLVEFTICYKPGGGDDGGENGGCDLDPKSCTGNTPFFCASSCSCVPSQGYCQ